jgi:hypothetical protein
MRILAEKPNPHGPEYAPSWVVDRFPRAPRMRPGMKLRAQDGATFYLQSTAETQTIRDGELTEVGYELGLAPAEYGGRQPRVDDILEVVDVLAR